MGGFSEEEFEKRNEKQKQVVIEAVKKADEAPFPDLSSLEEGVIVDE
jgi:TPP-dependent pyruvate/acetoin dehydrogenase alpha subunit